MILFSKFDFKFLFSLGLIFLSSILYCSSQVGDWESYLSHHRIIQADINWNDSPVTLTEGGIVIYNLSNGTHQFIDVKNGLRKIRFSNIHVDFFNSIWMGGKSPDGIVQLVNPEELNVINTFDFDLKEIHDIVSDSINVFAVYSNQDETGILHFIRNNNQWEYKDFYRSFPVEVTAINDAAFQNGQVLLATNGGILSGYTIDNLKTSSGWALISEFETATGVFFNPSPGYYTNTEIHAFIDSNEQTYPFPEILFNPVDFKIIEDQYCIINESSFGILDSIGYQIELENNPFSSGFVSILSQNCIAVELHGIICYSDNMENNSLYPPPNTPLQSHFSAITALSDGGVAAIGDRGLSVNKNDQWFNLYPVSFGQSFDPVYYGNYPLDYLLSSGADGSIYPSWSIVQSGENNMLFCNTGITPNQNHNKGPLIEVDILNLEVTIFDSTNRVLSGLDGIYNHGWLSDTWMVTNQIKTDDNGNIWVINPYAESTGNIIAIRPFQSDTWFHISAPDEYSYLPTELDFDSAGRAWIGFESRTSMENQTYSTGGLKVVRIIGGFDEPLNYTWNTLSSTAILPNENVWSVTVDDQDFVWVLTSGGVQGYFYTFSLSGIELNPIYPLDFYSYLPFFLGDHIRSDSHNTKWISTRHSGVKAILESTQFWPDVDGFTADNSGLLSNIVYDMNIDEENGIAWFATEMGISKFNMPVMKKAEVTPELLFSPNPFKIPKQQQLIIEGCTPGGTVIIQSSSGRYVKTLHANYLNQASTQVVWDGRDTNGNLVHTGIYLVSSRNSGEESKVGKFAVIRQ